jgi:carboxypeptidase Taq
MYNQFLNYRKKMKDVESAISLLNWDMETYMPEGAASMRSGHISTLSSIYHELATASDYESMLKNLQDDTTLNFSQKRNVELCLKDLSRAKKLPASYVEALSHATSSGFINWQKAVKAKDFSLFAPSLKKLLTLKKEEANYVGYEGHIYNAFLAEFEPGTTSEEVDIIFQDVKEKLIPLLKQITQKESADNSFLKVHFDEQKQWDFSLELLKQMGLDFKYGRQDKSHHPFSTSFGSEDCRVTTHVHANDVMNTIGSCIHEGGHALYEQGLSAIAYGLPEAQAISYGLHESQSRFWENNIGLSKAYWQYNLPRMQTYFPEQLQGIDLSTFYRAINIVRPSLIRTASDEITYHFHIMIRYEIEKALLTDQIKVEDLPAYWNAKYKEYLGIEVPDVAQGVLQDVHWSHGAFGYFPTYSLGSFYAAQWHAKLKELYPDFDAKVACGDLAFIKEWLNQNIHKHGRLYSASELCTKLTGEPLSFKYFLSYAQNKYLP